MALSRRSFLKTTGAALATPAILLAQVEAPSPPKPSRSIWKSKELVHNHLSKDRRIEGGWIEEIHPGDVVWFPPGVKHWHGATPTTAMTHIAIQEALDGKVVDWMEKVSDEQYET